MVAAGQAQAHDYSAEIGKMLTGRCLGLTSYNVEKSQSGGP